MKAIIENGVNYSPIPTRTIKREIQDDFCEILNIVLSCETEEQLISTINTELDFGEWNNFKVGFGSNHMWVKQVLNGKVKQQVIFVEF